VLRKIFIITLTEGALLIFFFNLGLKRGWRGREF